MLEKTRPTTISLTNSTTPAAPVSAVDATGVAHATAHLRATHRHEATPLQLAVDRLTAIIGWPGFVALLSLAIAVWIAANLVAARLGLHPLDPPPFAGLQAATATASLLMVALILASQRREDQLADHRDQLILELSISNDQKIAKIIGLLEESRRDNPAISNRVDEQAAAMSTPSDPDAVLEAIKDLRDDIV
jgi:uncharacterized membrane protein